MKKLTIKQDAINHEKLARQLVNFDSKHEVEHDEYFAAWVSWAAFVQLHYKMAFEIPTWDELNGDPFFI